MYSAEPLSHWALHSLTKRSLKSPDNAGLPLNVRAPEGRRKEERLWVGWDKRGGDYSDEPAGSLEAGAGLWKADSGPAGGREGASWSNSWAEFRGRRRVSDCYAQSAQHKAGRLPQAMGVKVRVTQFCPTLRPHGLYSPWNSPSRIPGWVAFPFSSGSSQPRNQPESPALQVDSLPTQLSGLKLNDTLF